MTQHTAERIQTIGLWILGPLAILSGLAYVALVVWKVRQL
jgi:hypothetical protein